MRYEIEMIYQKEDMQALTRASLYSRKTTRYLSNLSNLIFRIIGIFLVLLGSPSLFYTFKNLFTREYPWTFEIIAGDITGIGILFLGLFLIFRYSGKLQGNSLARILWRNYTGKGETFKYVFDDDGFTVYSLSGENHLYYTIMQKLYEDDKRLFLFTNKADAHIIIKSAFVYRDFDSFRQFILEKTELPIMAVK